MENGNGTLSSRMRNVTRCGRKQSLHQLALRFNELILQEKQVLKVIRTKQTEVRCELNSIHQTILNVSNLQPGKEIQDGSTSTDIGVASHSTELHTNSKSLVNGNIDDQNAIDSSTCASMNPSDNISYDKVPNTNDIQNLQVVNEDLANDVLQHHNGLQNKEPTDVNQTPKLWTLQWLGLTRDDLNAFSGNTEQLSPHNLQMTPGMQITNRKTAPQKSWQFLRKGLQESRNFIKLVEHQGVDPSTDAPETERHDCSIFVTSPTPSLSELSHRPAISDNSERTDTRLPPIITLDEKQPISKGSESCKLEIVKLPDETIPVSKSVMGKSSDKTTGSKYQRSKCHEVIPGLGDQDALPRKRRKRARSLLQLKQLGTNGLKELMIEKEPASSINPMADFEDNKLFRELELLRKCRYLRIPKQK